MAEVIGKNRFMNPAFPLSYQEMILLVPEEIREPGHEKHKAVFGLLQNMARHLEEARRVSAFPVDQYIRKSPNVPKGMQRQFQISGIQQHMSAVRFRLSIHDYSSEAERVILENRMLELYQEAKVIDPSGTSRFEHRIDKRMKRANKG